MSYEIKIPTCLASCLSDETIKSVSSKRVNFMDHEAFISQLEVFEINSFDVDDGFP